MWSISLWCHSLSYTSRPHAHRWAKRFIKRKQSYFCWVYLHLLQKKSTWKVLYKRVWQEQQQSSVTVGSLTQTINEQCGSCVRKTADILTWPLQRPIRIRERNEGKISQVTDLIEFNTWVAYIFQLTSDGSYWLLYLRNTFIACTLGRAEGKVCKQKVSKYV